MAVIIEQLTIRLYHGNSKDEAIADYLSQFDRAKQGVKSTRTKDLLYRGLQALEQEEESSLDLDAIRQIVREEMRGEIAQVTPSLDQGAVRRAVQEAMRSTAQEGDSLNFTLSDIRQVVSVVLDQKFDRLDITADKSTRAETDADDKAKAERDLNHLIESLKTF